jgi:hypothetical protein
MSRACRLLVLVPSSLLSTYYHDWHKMSVKAGLTLLGEGGQLKAFQGSGFRV